MERAINGEPHKFTGTIVQAANFQYEVRPDGFQGLTIPVHESSVFPAHVERQKDESEAPKTKVRK